VAGNKNISTGTGQADAPRTSDRRATNIGKPSADTGGGGISIKGQNVKIDGDAYTGNKIITSDKVLFGNEITALFSSIYVRIDVNRDLSSRDKADLKADVKEVEAEVAKAAKGQRTDESALDRRLRSIQRTSQDIFEMLDDTFAGSVTGPASVLRQAIDRVKREAA
jgi:hypothetical protein